MERGSAVMTNTTQAVCLPKTMQLPEGVTGVDIGRCGRVWTITPSGQSWASWFEGQGVSADFMVERAHPAEKACDAARHGYPDLHGEEPARGGLAECQSP